MEEQMTPEEMLRYQILRILEDQVPFPEVLIEDLVTAAKVYRFDMPPYLPRS